MALKIYHNPRCRKSRETLNLIVENGEQPEIVEYLKNPPSASEIKELVDKLGIDVEKLIRKNESVFKDNYKGKEISSDNWFEILSKNPILIERPIVVKGKQAVLGRPPENVLEFV